ncbi:aminotransferase class V-fold PLP-dependent enzyme [Streptomyces sp. WMMC500]|uniref:DegT/DnrJ/EryC1/StrS family aminotransferase n=1 Tax=Streptomyces sp. WMMC500 TaxID=3015154 RepID=UPI00248AD4CC|nr:aminotransferase class V-fold PLP-dependent enzyme [Streptomyces sp. WMMC500]WBB57747.1 aminotransferase class V-fold PLP-dependent enzyme [Streptomyces sp. WMMC500]
MTDSPAASLALLGGQPEITTPAPHFSWPPIDSRDIEAVTGQLTEAVSIPDRSGIVADLEVALAAWLGVRHVVTTSTGTAALHSMYAAAGIGPGDEVLVPALTFHATATPLLHLGARPVLVDVNADGQLGLATAASLVSPRTKALVAVHLWGLPENADALAAFAGEHGVMLLEDGSHAHGASWNGRLVGTYGRAAAFSLNGPKPLAAGEGGFVATDDTELYYRLLLHGQYNKRCRTEIPAGHRLAKYATTGQGLKLRIHPLAAALARAQLHRLEGYLTGRAACAERLCAALEDVPGLRVPRLGPAARASWYALPLRYESAALGGLPLARFLAAVHAEGATEVDHPGSTRPLGDHPLFHAPRELIPHYPVGQDTALGGCRGAASVHASTLKLPVWHRPEDSALADAYTAALAKVARHHKELL